MVQTKVTQKALLCDSRANKRRVVAIGQQPHGNDQRGGIDSPVVLMGLEKRLISWGLGTLTYHFWRSRPVLLCSTESRHIGVGVWKAALVESSDNPTTSKQSSGFLRGRGPLLKYLTRLT